MAAKKTRPGAMGAGASLVLKIENKQVVVGIIGMGYVGLPLALAFDRAGFRVLGFDIDPAKVKKLNRGESYLKHIGAGRVAAMARRGKFQATGDFRRLREADAIAICVPTPLTDMKEPDLSFVVSSAEQVAAALRRGQLVVLESTTWPGTTDEVLKPILERRGLRCGKDFFLAFSPEREDPGNPVYHTGNIPKVVGGVDPMSTTLCAALYGQVIEDVVIVSSARAAEMTKLLENIYRSVNIALVNELKLLMHRMGIDLGEVIRAAATKPFGFTPFYPGPGLGGHCIPLDPFYLSWKAREFDFSTRFIELAGEINTGMPYYVVERVGEALNRQGKALKGAKVLVLGVAYKKNVDDVRESPAITIIELLLAKGARVAYHDPHIPRLPKMRRSRLSMASTPLTAGLLRGQDCVVIVTDHDALDYQAVVDKSRLVVDTRDVTRGIARGRQKIVPA
jgi:UDP-N-acetyl-D-glucosamine dehydrogenase